jgi:glycosyltransferase involved in cell wall biosynthesis
MRQIAASPASEQIELVPEFQSDEYAAEYFARADIVVLPYRHVTGSGVVPVAMRYARPVIASDLPGFRETVVPGVTGWLAHPQDTGHLASLIRERLERGDAGALRPGLMAARERMTWPRFARAVLVSARAPTAQTYADRATAVA